MKLFCPGRTLALALLVPLSACGGSDGDPTAPPPPESPVVTTISVSPGTPALIWGDQTTLRATAFDQNGAVMSGISFTWTSQDAGVATVDGAGTVSGVNVGTTTISARAGQASGTATLEVKQKVIAVEAPAASVLPYEMGFVILPSGFPATAGSLEGQVGDASTSFVATGQDTLVFLVPQLSAGSYTGVVPVDDNQRGEFPLQVAEAPVAEPDVVVEEVVGSMNEFLDATVANLPADSVVGPDLDVARGLVAHFQALYAQASPEEQQEIAAFAAANADLLSIASLSSQAAMLGPVVAAAPADHFNEVVVLWVASLGATIWSANAAVGSCAGAFTGVGALACALTAAATGVSLIALKVSFDRTMAIPFKVIDVLVDGLADLAPSPSLSGGVGEVAVQPVEASPTGRLALDGEALSVMASGGLSRNDAGLGLSPSATQGGGWAVEQGPQASSGGRTILDGQPYAVVVSGRLRSVVAGDRGSVSSLGSFFNAVDRFHDLWASVASVIDGARELAGYEGPSLASEAPSLPSSPRAEGSANLTGSQVSASVSGNSDVTCSYGSSAGRPTVTCTTPERNDQSATLRVGYEGLSSSFPVTVSRGGLPVTIVSVVPEQTNYTGEDAVVDERGRKTCGMKWEITVEGRGVAVWYETKMQMAWEGGGNLLTGEADDIRLAEESVGSTSWTFWLNGGTASEPEYRPFSVTPTISYRIGADGPTEQKVGDTAYCK